MLSEIFVEGNEDPVFVVVNEVDDGPKLGLPPSHGTGPAAPESTPELRQALLHRHRSAPAPSLIHLEWKKKRIEKKESLRFLVYKLAVSP